MDDLLNLQTALGLRFQDQELLQQALVHRSYLNESAELPLSASNERLEFLGDAVLGMLVAAELYRRFPESPEGRLTEMRAHFVRGATLARIGEHLDLGRYLVLGRGEERTGGRGRAPNLGRALEAVVGAVYLDAGIEAARDLVARLFDSEMEQLHQDGLRLDAKSSLQQFAQAALRVTPQYVTVAAEGPEHAREFVVEVYVGPGVAGIGRGRRKRQAQQEAAGKALEALAGTSVSDEPDPNPAARARRRSSR